METPQKEPVAMKRSRGVVVVDEVGELASLVRSRSAEAEDRSPPPAIHQNAPRLQQHDNRLRLRLLHHRPSSSPYSA